VLTVSEENAMPTMQNLSEVQRKCGVRGRRGSGGGSNDDFPGVEIAITGVVGEMVRALTTATFFLFFLCLFFFLSRLLIDSIGATAQLCSFDGSRYNGHSTKHGPCSPKPPTTVDPATPKLKPSDPARKRKPPPCSIGRNYKEIRKRA